MKRIYLLFIMMLALCITGCKDTSFNNVDYKKIDYYVCGLYINVTDTKTMKVSDDNPFVIFDFSSSSRSFYTSQGSKDGATDIYNISKTVDEDLHKYYGQASLKVKDSSVDNVELFPIICKDGELMVDSSRHQKITIKEKTSFNYHVEYTYDGDKYDLSIKLLFIK